MNKSMMIVEASLWGDRDLHAAETEGEAREIAHEVLCNWADNMNRRLIERHGVSGAVIDPYIGDDWQTCLRQMQRAWIVATKPEHMLEDHMEIPEDVCPADLSDYLTDEGLDIYSECWMKMTLVEAKAGKEARDEIEREIQLPPPAWAATMRAAMTALEGRLYTLFGDEDEDDEGDADSIREIFATAERLAWATPEIGKATFYVGAIDTNNGGTLSVTGWSEAEVTKNAVERGGGDYDAYLAWLAEHSDEDGNYQAASQYGGDPVCDYMQSHHDDCFGWTYDSVDIPSYAAAPVPEVAVVLDGGDIQKVVGKGGPVRVHFVGMVDDILDNAFVTAWPVEPNHDPAFWAAVTRRAPERRAVHRRLVVSFVDRGDEPRVSVFGSDDAALEDLAEYYDEFKGEDDPDLFNRRDIGCVFAAIIEAGLGRNVWIDDAYLAEEG